MNNTSTYSNQSVPSLTIEDIKKASEMIYKQKEKDLPSGFSWLAKLMAKFGWHREYEIIVFDKSKMNNWLIPKRAKAINED